MRARDLTVLATRWIESYLCLKPGSVSGATTVNHDLGLAGEDGVEFVRAFSLHFNLDHANFPFERYFGAETAIGPVVVAQSLVNLIRGRAIFNREVLSVSHLLLLLSAKT